MLAQSDLEAAAGSSTLANAYDLIVFPGHHEYVTTREYDLVEGYRDRGGNLLFLSANNFFWQVVERGNTITKTALWRDLGRPEAALVGVQYLANGKAHSPWIVRRAPAGGWIFAGTSLQAGSPLGREESRSTLWPTRRRTASRCSRRSRISSGRAAQRR